LTIGAGGSAGNVGPCAQIGGALASWVAGLFRFSDADRKTLVICGISAGFASVLGAPIAGALPERPIDRCRTLFGEQRTSRTRTSSPLIAGSPLKSSAVQKDCHNWQRLIGIEIAGKLVDKVMKSLSWKCW